MLKDKELTADDARKIAKSNTKVLNPSLEAVLSKIEVEAKKGNTVLLIKGLSQNILSMLRGRGFKVGRVLYSDDNVRISWD